VAQHVTPITRDTSCPAVAPHASAAAGRRRGAAFVNGRVAAARCRGVLRSPPLPLLVAHAVREHGGDARLFPFEIAMQRVVVWW